MRSRSSRPRSSGPDVQVAGVEIPQVNDLTNKAVLWVGTAIGAAIVSAVGALMWFGVRYYVDSIYVQKIDAYDAQIEYLDRRSFEIDEVFMIAGSELDPATSRRLGADKSYYENQKAIVLRRREDLRE